MERVRRIDQTRREFLRLGIEIPVMSIIAAFGAETFALPSISAGKWSLPPTPACGDDDAITPSALEGPYFKPDSPERASFLEHGIKGRKIIVEGRVLSKNCKAIPRSLVDFWQADGDGLYDHNGFRLRGHQFTDGEGRFLLETILPGAYSGRSRHIHVKVQSPNGPLLTTQIFFPGEPLNKTDRFFDLNLTAKMEKTSAVRKAFFDFVLNLNATS